MTDDRPSITSSRLSSADVARHTFGTVRRGFEPREVRDFLVMVSKELQSWEQREQDLRAELGEAEERAKHPVLDESTISSVLGQQSAKVLRSAHDEASRILAAAAESVAAMTHEAQRRAAEVEVKAEAAAAERIADAELATGAIRQEIEREMSAAKETARLDAEVEMGRAREEGRALVERAHLARREVLADLVQRRRELHVQIEQFRAARDELKTAVLGTRRSVDDIVADLTVVDTAARSAAARIGMQPPPDAGALTVEELERLDDEERPKRDGQPENAHDAEDESPAVASDAGRSEAAAEVVTEPAVVAVTEPNAEAVTGPGAEGVTEPGAEAVTEPGPIPTESAEDAAGEASQVEDLFARLRASHTEKASDSGRAEPSDSGRAEPSDTEAGIESVDEGPEVVVVDGETDAVLRLVHERADLLDPVTVRLTRGIKRALQDDQNRLLDKIRSCGHLAEDVLEPEEDQRAALAGVSSRLLKDAYLAGAKFARSRSSSGTKLTRPGRTLDRQATAEAQRHAEEAASSVVNQLRKRLLDGPRLDGDSPADDTAERVGAAYREWRGERIERLVGDTTVAAFSAGVLSVMSQHDVVQWLPANGPAACPDCDDNSLAGAVPAGEEFPTGHVHPPAHSGCRCLVAPTSG